MKTYNKKISRTLYVATISVLLSFGLTQRVLADGSLLLVAEAKTQTPAKSKSKSPNYKAQIFREFKPLGVKMVCHQQKYLACIKIKKPVCRKQVRRAHSICSRRLHGAVPPMNSKRERLNQFSTKYLNCIVKEHVVQVKKPKKLVDVCLKKLK
jgi:hypothetical protein